MQAEEKWPTVGKVSSEKLPNDSPDLSSQAFQDPERALSGTTVAREEIPRRHSHHLHLLHVPHIPKLGWRAIALAVFTFCLVVLAVVLGAVYGTRRHDAIIGSSQTSSGSGSNSSSEGSVRYPSIAATVTNSTSPQAKVFYYDNERKDIMCYSYNQTWDFHGALQSLPTQPRKGNSLAAVSWADNGNLSTRLFYIDTSSKIMQLNPICNPGTACEYGSDHIILSPSSILPNSNLAAVHWGNSTSKRISLFYVGTGNKIHEMRSNSDGQFSGDNVLGIEVYPDSSLAATWDSDLGNEMSMFFTSPDQKLQEYRYEEGVWQTPTDINVEQNTGMAISAYSPTANIAATTIPMSMSNSSDIGTRTYRIDSTGYPAEISYGTFDGNTAEWESARQPQWLKADNIQGGGIAAISWYESDQYSARFYYPSNGVIAEMALDGTTWSVGSFQSN